MTHGLKVKRNPQSTMKTANLTRRSFIKTAAKVGASVAIANSFFSPLMGEADSDEKQEASSFPLHEAMHYKKLQNKSVQCILEPRQCHVNDGERGNCGVRENRDGVYYTLVYAMPCAVYVEPIERGHFYHVLPGQKMLGIGTAGCNLQCKYCESWQISQARPEDTPNQPMKPQDVVERAIKEKCPVIVFTYNEPTVYFEYILAVAKAAKEKGLITAAHTAGCIHTEPLKEVCEYLDAVNIDLKGFTDAYYREICGVTGWFKLEHVLNAIKTVRATKAMLEIINLIVPGQNDKAEMIANMCAWIKENVGVDTPLHFARFFPSYQLMKLYATPIETLEEARNTAKATGLQYVYLDNVGAHEATSTFCPKCKTKVIERTEAETLLVGLKDGKCSRCGERIPGVF